jgi:large subunit ribosomal protein L19
MQDIIKEVTKEYMRKVVPLFAVGDTVKVFSKIKEGDKERLQAFEGIVIKRQGGGIGETFTVRRIVMDVGVERTFPLHSPFIDRVQVMKQGRVRRAKLYYLRKRIGIKATRVEEKK